MERLAASQPYSPPLPFAEAGNSLDELILQQEVAQLSTNWTDALLEDMAELIATSPRMLKHLFRRFQCNAFYATDDLFRPLSACVYTAASLINHQCVPNAICQYHKHELRIRTLRDLREGEELTIAYVDLLDPYPQRKEHLKVEYGFECDCPACPPQRMPRTRFEELRDELTKLLLSPRLKGLLNREDAYELFADTDRGLYAECGGDGVVISADLRGEWPGTVNRALHAAVERECDAIDRAASAGIDTAELIMMKYRATERLSASLHPLHKTLYGLRSGMFSSLLEIDDVDSAVAIGEHVLVTLAFVYDAVPHHPQVNLLLNTYLDLRRELDPAFTPRALYRRIHTAYRVVYGTHHPFTVAVADF